MRPGRLPTVPATAPTDDGCPDCTRRLVVQALGVTAAASLLGLGCGGGGDDPTPDSGIDPLAGTMMCGADLCVLLNDPANALLAGVEGSRVITLPGEKLLVVRTATDAFAVLSAVCTHAGCTVRYDAPSDQAACPCHGSRFSLSGAVAQGPAARALKRYLTTYDAAAQTLTIML
jgi:Rieske Fe-S protein